MYIVFQVVDTFGNKTEIMDKRQLSTHEPLPRQGDLVRFDNYVDRVYEVRRVIFDYSSTGNPFDTSERNIAITVSITRTINLYE
jgi:hypothetical protein